MEILTVDALNTLPENVQTEVNKHWEMASGVINTLKSYYGDEKSFNSIEQILGLYKPAIFRYHRLEDHSNYENDGNTTTPGKQLLISCGWQLDPDEYKSSGNEIFGGYASNCIAFTAKICWRVKDCRLNNSMGYTTYFCGNHPNEKGKYYDCIYWTSGTFSQLDETTVVNLILKIDNDINIRSIKQRLKNCRG